MDWVDHAVCAYLLLPALLFCVWFITPVAVTLLALVSYGVYRVFRSNSTQPTSISAGWIVLIFCLALAWTAISGVGHFFFTNSDWIVRDAVLHDLSQGHWPPRYQWLDGSQFILRAPIAYFLPAAIVGQVGGLTAANLALYLWTALGWALVLLAGCRLFETRIQRITCLLVLTCFGGMDLLGYLWAHGRLPMLGEHIEWWLPTVQYSSNSTLLAWVPNHALPAWLGTLILLRHWRQPSLALITPLLATAIPLWSPLAAIGLFPFFLFGLAWRRDFKILFAPNTCLVFLPFALLIAAYLELDAAAVPQRWQINNFVSTEAFLYCMLLFGLLEFGLLALILSRLVRFDLSIKIALCTLCLLPIYCYGPGNDLAMRSSIPSLLVLAIATVRPLTTSPWTIWRALLALTLAIGALGSAQEPIRGLIGQRWLPHKQTIPESMARQGQNASPPFPAHYFASFKPHGVQRLLRTPPLIVVQPSTSTAKQ